MCGIVGIAALSRQRGISSDVLAAMNASIVHRGPDGDGHWVDVDRVGLAMRRLAIIDVSGGDQPLRNEDGSITVVFNGEIYNFTELRKKLEAKGHRFRSHSDGEVIAHGYEEYGDAILTHLRGMFAIALWDARCERLLIARDRVGIKPLFWTVAEGQLIWGSEIKALLCHPAVPRRMSPAALNHYLTFMYTPAPLTFFEGIEELEPAHALVLERGQIRISRYWNLEYTEEGGMQEADAVAGLRERLDEAVRIRMIAEVPLGAFLSGGIDSSTIVALMSRSSTEPVHTFSIGYGKEGQRFDERELSRELARHVAAEHREFEVSADLVSLAPRIVRAFDQPCADSTVLPMWSLCEETRKHVTVALSGLGGDELAAGYERHRGVMLAESLSSLPDWFVTGPLRWLSAWLPDSRSGGNWPQRIKRFASSASLPFDERYFELIAQLSSAQRSELLAPDVARELEIDDPLDRYREVLAQAPGASPLQRALYADLRFYLPGDLLAVVDRVSMAHSLEVRVPFLDHHLLEFAATIPSRLFMPGGEKKRLIRQLAQDLIPKTFFNQPKRGFSAPMAIWFRGELREFVEDTLSATRLARAGAFNPAGVRKILDDHFGRRANYDNVIWALLVFTLWHSEYIEEGRAT